MKLYSWIMVGLVALPGVSQSKVISQVGNRAITDEDLQQLVANLPLGQREQLLGNPASRSQLTTTLEDQEVLVQTAAKDKLEESKEYREAYQIFRRQTLAAMVVKKNLETKITEDRLKEYYNKNKHKYSTDQVHAYHILVDSEVKAKELLAALQKPGADFLALAEKESKDPSAKNNRGDLGYFTRDLFDPKFSDAAFSGKPNELLGPVKTPFGFHIIKVVDFKRGRQPEYPEVETKVRAELQRTLIDQFVAEARKTVPVKRL